MRKLAGYFGIVIVSLMLAMPTAYAQTSQGSGSQESGARSSGTQGQSLLPEINPQDIEIRSQFRARFPGIRRQPILGFNPRPRIFRINPNRMPFIELPEERAANLPVIGLQRPALSEFEPFSYADPGQAFVKAGYGSLSSPFADVYLAPQPGSGKRTVYSGALHTRSSASHLDRQPGAFRNSDLTVRLLHKRKNHDLIDADLRVVSRFNYLPVTETADGLAVTGGSAVDSGGADADGSDAGGDGAVDADGAGAVPALVPGTERIRQEGFLLRGSYTQNTRSPLGWSAEATWFGDRYERSRVGGGLADDGGADGSGVADNGATDLSVPFEAGGTVSLDYVRAGSRVEEYQGAQFYFDGGSVRSAAGTAALQGVTGLSASVQRLLQNRSEAKVRLGAAFVFDDLDKNRIYPLVDAMYRRTIFRNVAVRATLEAAPALVRVADLRAQNRFYTIDRTPVHRYDLEARAEVIGEPIRGTSWSAEIFYGFTRNRPWFERVRGDVIVAPADGGDGAANQPVTVRGGYTVQSDDAVQFGLSATGTHALANGTLWLDINAYIQSVRFRDGGNIPFTETLGASATISWRPVSKLVLRPELQFLGSRAHSEPGFRDLPAMVLLNVSAELRFSKRFGAFVELHHLTNQSYELWDGFEEQPFQMLGGVRLQW